MKLTLRQARRLEREIESAILEVLHEGVKVRNVAITAYQDFDETIRVSNETAIATVEKADRLNKIRFSVRRAIQCVHELEGLNDLMSEEAMLKRSLQLIDSVLVPEFTDKEQTIAKARHKAVLSAESATQNAYGQLSDQISVTSIVTKNTLDQAKTSRKAIEKRLRAIADKSAALNSSGTIELQEEAIAFVESLGIVV